MNNDLEAIHEQTLNRYSERYQKLGKHVQTLGWGTEEQQEKRFEQLLELNLDFRNKHIADIGCGFGDLALFLKGKQIPFETYSGLDINPHLLQEARSNFETEASIRFFQSALPEWPQSLDSIDIAIMLGVLNVNLKSQIKNQNYSRQLITSVFEQVKTALVVDFLSTELTSDYPREDFVFYHEPAEMLRFGLTLSPRVRLYHDYAPIPQREFMLVIIKENP